MVDEPSVEMGARLPDDAAFGGDEPLGVAPLDPAGAFGGAELLSAGMAFDGVAGEPPGADGSDFVPPAPFDATEVGPLQSCQKYSLLCNQEAKDKLQV